MDRSTLVRRVAPLAVFAAVLGGVTVIAARTGGSGDAANGAPKPLPLNAASGRDDSTREAGAATTDMAYGGPLVIPDELARGAATQGPAYRIAGRDVTAERVAALARALGVDGEVRTVENGWAVGTEDRTLRVHAHPAPMAWYLGADKEAAVRNEGSVASSPQPAPDEPVSGEPAREEPVKPEPAATASDTPLTTDPCEKACTTPGCPPSPPGAEPACAPMPEPTKPPQPTDAEARLVAQRVFDAVGLDGPEIRVGDGWVGKEVVAAPLVGGLPTLGFETRVVVALGGEIVHASGVLGSTAREGDYPLLAPQDAADRNSGYGGARPAIADAPCEAHPCPKPAERVAKKLRLGLVLMHSFDPDRGAYLAPAWLVTVEESFGEESVLALPDEYLETPPEPDGGAVPPDTAVSSDSGGGSDGSTGSAP